MKKIAIAIVLLFLISNFGCSNSNSKYGNESQESSSQIDSYDSRTANPSLVEKPITTNTQTDDESTIIAENTVQPQGDKRDDELRIGRYITDDGASYVQLDEGSSFVFNLSSVFSYQPNGIFSVADGKLILAGGSGEEYVFVIKKNGLLLEFESTNMSGGVSHGNLYAFSDNQKQYTAQRAIDFATQRLTEIKKGSSVFYEPLDFTEAEIAYSYIGFPFTIYLFDDDGRFIGNNDDNFIFPILNYNDIIGIIEVAYLPDTDYARDFSYSDFSFTFGRSFGDGLNNLKDRYAGVDLIIGNMGTRLLFAICGNEVSVFTKNYGDDITEEQIGNVLASINSAVENPNYFRLPD